LPRLKRRRLLSHLLPRRLHRNLLHLPHPPRLLHQSHQLFR
jgi:hypothetical protein